MKKFLFLYLALSSLSSQASNAIEADVAKAISGYIESIRNGFIEEIDGYHDWPQAKRKDEIKRLNKAILEIERNVFFEPDFLNSKEPGPHKDLKTLINKILERLPTQDYFSYKVHRLYLPQVLTMIGDLAFSSFTLYLTYPHLSTESLLVAASIWLPLSLGIKAYFYYFSYDEYVEEWRSRISNLLDGQYGMNWGTGLIRRVIEEKNKELSDTLEQIIQKLENSNER